MARNSIHALHREICIPRDMCAGNASPRELNTWGNIYHCDLYIASLLVICACAGKHGSVVMCAGNTILGETHITVTQVTFLSDHSESPDR